MGHAAAPLMTGRSGNTERIMNVTLMMLILAFFIVLNALSVPANDKRKAALGSLIGALGIMPGGISPMSSETKEFYISAGYVSAERINFSAMLGKFEEYLVQEKSSEFFKSALSTGGLELSIQSRYLFVPGTAGLTSRGEQMLDWFAGVIRQIDGNLVIEGHTSDRRIATARYPDNVRFSIARAGMVARGLIRRGVDPRKLGVIGYGDTHPASPNDTPEHRAANERIRVVYQFALEG